MQSSNNTLIICGTTLITIGLMAFSFSEYLLTHFLVSMREGFDMTLNLGGIPILFTMLLGTIMITIGTWLNLTGPKMYSKSPSN